MSRLDPHIDAGAGGNLTLRWTADPAAKGYLITTPTGSGTAGAARTTSNLGKHTSISVSISSLYAQPAETAVYPAVVDPPTNRPAFAKGGIGFWEPGANVPPGSDRYDLGILANWQYDGGQKNQAGLKLLYTAARCPDSPDYFYGMTSAKLLALEWAALTSNGVRVYSTTSPHGVIPDLTDQAFALAWAANVAAYLDQHGLDGVEIDDIDGKRSELFSATIPVYPSEQAWQDANVQFIQTAAGYLRDRGFYVCANTSGDDAYKLRVAQHVDAVMLETFTVSQLDTARKILAAGCDAVALAYTNPVQVRAAMETLGDPRAVTMYHSGGDPWVWS